MADAYSIRESLQGALTDFVRTSGFSCVSTEEIVRELVGLLAVYREEGALLFPEVYVLLNEDALHVIAPSTERVVLGEVSDVKEAAETCLKRCAALAAGGWSVYIAKAPASASSFKFGLFRSMRHAFSAGAEEAMADLGDQFPVLLVRNRGHLVVELKNSKGKFFTATLRTIAAAPSPLAEHVSTLASKLEVAEPYRQYFIRLLTRVLQECHGTLVAVVAASSSAEDTSLSDGVWLNPPLALQNRYAEAIAKKDADSLADLQAAEHLLEGMMNSDGVVLLGGDGTIRAFRIFLRPEPGEREKLPHKGGGRRRTYELMKLRLNTKFNAVLIRSQDGDIDCRRVES